MKLTKNQLATTDELNPIFDEIEGSIEELRSSIEEKITLDDLPEVEPLPKFMEVSLKGVSVLTLKGDKGEKGDKGNDGVAGKNGKDGLNGVNGLDGIDGKDADEITIIDAVLKKIPEVVEKTPNEEIDKINLATKQIKTERVEGLQQAIMNGASNAVQSYGTAQSPRIGGRIGEGTTGSIIFVNPSASFAQDNANLFWDTTGKKLKIGSTSILAFDNGSGTADTGLSRRSAGVLSLGNGTSNDASGTLWVRNVFGQTGSGGLLSFNGVLLNGTSYLALGNAVLQTSSSSGVIKLVLGGGTSTRSFPGTSGIVTGVWVASGADSTMASTSGDVSYTGFDVEPTFNTTGTFAGTLTALRISPFLQSTTGATAINLLDIGTNSAGAGAGTHTSKFRIDSTGIVTATAPVILKGYTVAGLPTGIVGMTAYVTDALAPTFLTAVVGGGGCSNASFL